MGQVFTGNVDVTKLKEGAWARVVNYEGKSGVGRLYEIKELRRFIFCNNSFGWENGGAHESYGFEKCWTCVEVDGSFISTQSIELIDPPAEFARFAPVSATDKNAIAKATEYPQPKGTDNENTIE